MSAETLPLEDAPTVKLADLPILADRSTLDNYAKCPLMARLRESRFRSVDAIAVSGEEAHKAISQAIITYVDSGGALNRNDMIEQIRRNVWGARPDVSQDASDALKYSIYDIASYLSDIHHSNILAFDGGDEIEVTDVITDEETGEQKRVKRSLSGQFHHDVQVGRQIVRLTAEMDLLHSTKSPGLLRLMDWKSGWKSWTESTVASELQFRFYAFLVLENYPDIEAVDVVIWNIRSKIKLFPVRFERKDMDQIRAHIQTIAGDFLMNRNAPLERVEARPTREGCRLCSCAAECTACDRDLSEIVADPYSATDRLYALSRKMEEIQKTLTSYARIHGDIVTPAGNCWGFNKPKANRKPTAKLYTGKPGMGDDDGDE